MAKRNVVPAGLARKNQPRPKPRAARSLTAANFVNLQVKKMSEGELQSDVINLARRHGWRVAHFRTSQTGGRWVTAVAADGSGFPDLVLAKPGRAVLFVELKREANDLSEDQKTWKEVIDASTTATVEIWRPSDWFSGLIEARLTAAG